MEKCTNKENKIQTNPHMREIRFSHFTTEARPWMKSKEDNSIHWREKESKIMCGVLIKSKNLLNKVSRSKPLILTQVTLL